MMWALSTILVPTDFSEIAAAATDVAVELARKFESKIVLFHAYQVPVYSYPATPYVPVAEIATSLQEAATLGLASVQKTYAESGVDMTTAIDSGVPWEQI